MSKKHLSRNVDIFGGSDFHLEFAVKQRDFDVDALMPPVEIDADAFNVCLLAGDITVPKKTHRYVNWFETFCSKFDLVLYIEGNHEHWRGYVGQNFNRLKLKCSHIENLHFLRRETFEFEVGGLGFSVVSATLWSDLGQNDYSSNYDLCVPSANYGRAIVQDFNFIRELKFGSFPRLKVPDYVRLHRDDVRFVEQESNRLSSSENYKILLTHHSPTKRSLWKYDGHKPTYDAFDATDLESLIKLGGFNIVFHGHIHRDVPFIENFHGALLASNPAGYGEIGKEGSNYRLIKLASIPV